MKRADLHTALLLLAGDAAHESERNARRLADLLERGLCLEAENMQLRSEVRRMKLRLREMRETCNASGSQYLSEIDFAYVVELRDTLHLSWREIGLRLGVDKETARWRYKRAFTVVGQEHAALGDG